MTKLAFKFHYKRHLPHIQPPGATFFVTFRLAGTIPTAVLHHLQEEAAHTDAILDQIEDPQERKRCAYQTQRHLFGQWDAVLDAAAGGPKWLSDERVAKEVCDSLHYRDGRVYDLDCFCLMPNHGHVVFTPRPAENDNYHSLSSIMHSLKRYTARQANAILGREGQFWQHESYDHIVRDDAELGRIRRYIRNNPVKAGLVADADAWPWTYCRWLR